VDERQLTVDEQRAELEEIAEAREIRRATVGALSMSERLERRHQLCAQLAQLEPVPSRRP
jgi:hypothetical protein